MAKSLLAEAREASASALDLRIFEEFLDGVRERNRGMKLAAA